MKNVVMYIKKTGVIFLVALCALILFKSCQKDNQEEISDSEVNYSGAIADPNAFFTRFSLPSSGSSKIPTTYDLSYLMPPVRNQGRMGSCVGFALSALKSYHEQLEYGYGYKDDSKIMSPAFIYNQNKEYGDCNSGAQTIKALNFLKSDGCATEIEFPYNENDCYNLPNTIIKQNAIKNKIKEWQGFFFQNNPDVLTEIKYAISQQQPVVIDFKVDAEFTKLNLFSWSNYIWSENSSGDPKENGVSKPGYHCALLVGYDDDIKAFKLYNSWGSIWKNGGYCWVDYNWFLKRVRYAMMTWDEFHKVDIISSINISGSCPAEVYVGSSRNFVMTISNTGTKELNISDFNIKNNTGAFSFVNSKPNFPLILQSGGNYSVSIKFAPTFSGLHSSSFVVNSNADSGQATSSLVGNATPVSSGNNVTCSPGLNTFVGCNEQKTYKTYISATCKTNYFKIKCTQVSKENGSATFVVQTCDDSKWNKGRTYVQIFNNNRSDGYDANSTWLENGSNSVTIIVNNLIFDNSKTKTLVCTLHLNGIEHYCTGELVFNW